MDWGRFARQIVIWLGGARERFEHAAAGPPYPVTSMLPEYVGEHLPDNDVWDGNVVVYLPGVLRIPYALVFRAGRIYDHFGRPFDTSAGTTLQSNANRAIFVMDADGTFFASHQHAVGEFHHSSLAAGQPVAAAGELEVVAGQLTAISDRSGHYRPRLRFTRHAIAELQRNNISLANVTYDFVGAP